MKEEVNPSLEEIEEAFSIDNVTKEFFLEYKELFLQLKESLEQVLKKDEHVQKEFEEKNISTVDFAKKLLGQIVFIYFLQKKGWLGVKVNEKWGTGPKDFMRQLIGGGKKQYTPLVHYDNFFNDILEPLFYDALANPREGEDGYYRLFKCKMPFLNGGLFEPINDYSWEKTDIIIKDQIFKDIFDTFDRFNFTVKEDEPLEKEVAVDPEMLGKVFENLLDVQDRKSRGAFYTPREIVHYMCQQSLINYLETNTEIPIGDIEKFIQLGDFAIDLMIIEQEQIREYGRSYDIDEKRILPKSIKENYQKIERLLKDIKIVDPAVGSGAFPVGMMNEIVKARSVLTVFFDKSKQKNRTNYKFKSETIENSLYGVDIDSSAVDIAKLRFWLSLIVDESDITDIQPLPNLDHKIMCGNSLLEEFEGVKLFDEELLGEIPKDNSFELEPIDRAEQKLNQELHEIYTGKKENKGRSKEIKRELEKLKRKRKQIISSPKEDVPQLTLDEAVQTRRRESQRKVKELKRLQKLFFNERGGESKRRYRSEIDRIEWELIEETLKEEGNEEAMGRLEQYKRNKSKPFFLWKLYFSDVFQRENPGFDVVIANPPYVDSENMVKNMRKQREELACKYLTAKGNWDLYIPFYELAYNISKTGGIVSYITPNKWLSIGYGKQLRKMLGIHLLQICNCSEIKVFEEVGNSPVITFVKKDIANNEIAIHSFSNDYIIRKGKPIPSSLVESDNWGILLSKHLDILLKIFNSERRVFQICDVENPFTVSEAYNFVDYVFDGENGEGAGHLKMLNTGTIDKYISLWGLKLTSYIKRKYKYPFVKKGLFRNSMPKRYEQSISKKIIITGIRHFECFLDCNGEYVAGKSTIIIRNAKDDFSLETIISLLNSNIICFYITEAYSALGIDGGINFSSKLVQALPIPKFSETKQKQLISFVDQILSITKDADYPDNPEKQSRVKELEKEIDKLVYKLYDLTPEEIDIVENFNKGK
jgi:F0F1-type ATP synthase membrane subunit b/b'